MTNTSPNDVSYKDILNTASENVRARINHIPDKPDLSQPRMLLQVVGPVAVAIVVGAICVAIGQPMVGALAASGLLAAGALVGLAALGSTTNQVINQVEKLGNETSLYASAQYKRFFELNETVNTLIADLDQAEADLEWTTRKQVDTIPELRRLKKRLDAYKRALRRNSEFLEGISGSEGGKITKQLTKFTETLRQGLQQMIIEEAGANVRKKAEIKRHFEEIERLVSQFEEVETLGSEETDEKDEANGN